MKKILSFLTERKNIVIYNLLLGITLITVLFASVCNLVNFPFWDEAWRVILIREGMAAINTTAPLYFRFMRSWADGSGLLWIRIFIFTAVLLSWLLLGICLFFFLRQDKSLNKPSAVFALAGTAAACSLFQLACHTTYWKQAPDYETLPLIFCNILFTCFIILQTDSMNKGKYIAAIIGGIVGIQFIFVSAPAFLILCIILLLLLCLRQFKFFGFTVLGAFAGLFLYFCFIQSPLDCYLFIKNAVMGTLHSGDSHSLSQGVLPWLKNSVTYLLKSSIIPACPIFFMLFYEKQWKNPILWLLPVLLSVIIILRWCFAYCPIFVISEAPISLTHLYGIAFCAFLLMIARKFDGINKITWNEISLYILMLIIPFFARMGSNLPLVMCGQYYLPYLFLLLLTVFLRTYSKALWLFLIVFLFFSFLFIAGNLFRNPPLLLRSDKKELVEFNFPHIFASNAQYQYYKNMKCITSHCPYLVCHWEGWIDNFILNKKALDYENFHYVQHYNISKLILTKNIPYRDIAFGLMQPASPSRNMLDALKLEKIVSELEAEQISQEKVGNNTIVCIRRKE